MSILLLLACVGVVVLGLVGVVVLVVSLSKKGGSPTSAAREGVVPAGPVSAPRAPVGHAPLEPSHARDVLFVLRFPDQDRGLVEGAVARLAPGGQLARGAFRDAALELVRGVPHASHAYVGPAAGDPTAACSPEPGGVLMALRAVTATPLSTVADDSDAMDVDATLRALASLPDAQLRHGALRVVPHSDAPGVPRLSALGQGRLPGHRPCAFCQKPMPIWETRCGSCGGVATA